MKTSCARQVFLFSNYFDKNHPAGHHRKIYHPMGTICRYFFGDLPHSYCLGDSVHIGGAAEAWLRKGASRAAKLREAVETGSERRLAKNEHRGNTGEHRKVAKIYGFGGWKCPKMMEKSGNTWEFYGLWAWKPNWDAFWGVNPQTMVNIWVIWSYSGMVINPLLYIYITINMYIYNYDIYISIIIYICNIIYIHIHIPIMFGFPWWDGWQYHIY